MQVTYAGAVPPARGVEGLLPGLRRSRREVKMAVEAAGTLSEAEGRGLEAS